MISQNKPNFSSSSTNKDTSISYDYLFSEEEAEELGAGRLKPLATLRRFVLERT
jgi:hypothetical protein